MTALFVSRPDVLDGEPCLAGTRIPVGAIWQFVALGFADSAIQREYPTLTEEQLEAARALVEWQK